MYKFVKRVFDILFSLVILLILGLPMIIICVIIRLDSKGPAIFKQERIGKDGKPINIYKFRTMIPDADKLLKELLSANEGMATQYALFKKLDNDPRVTRIGNILRKYSIDEFPQFINVLKGDMSIVGPRPYLFREKEDMGEYADDVVAVKPGITGYWQVNGRSNTDFVTRVKMDKYYMDHKSAFMDFKIFVKTFTSIIFKDGAK